ncbi:MAG: cache and HAMP domain-containing protein [Pseudomonadota bacterium]|nr:cache and HAMP domain-containing protein [Pseudomonadota bacterium]
MAEKKEGFGLTIFHKMLLAMLVVALLPLGGFWYLSRQRAVQDWAAAAGDSLNRVAAALADEVDSWVGANLRVLRQNAALDDIRSMDAGRQTPVLKSIAAVYDWSYLVHTLANDGQNISRSDGQPGRSYADRRYYQHLVKDGKAAAGEVAIGRTTGEPALILAVPVVPLADAGRGALVMAMRLTEISRTVTQGRIGRSGLAFLVDETGKVIAHPNPDHTSGELKDLSGHPALAAAAQEQGLISYEDDGRPVVAAAHKTGQGWTLVVQQDRDEAFAAVQAADRHALLLLAVTMVIVLAVALLLSRRLAGPITRLTAVADDMSRGKLGADIAETRRRDEIGALARAIERMGVSIQMAIEKLRKRV